MKISLIEEIIEELKEKEGDTDIIDMHLIKGKLSIKYNHICLYEVDSKEE